MGVIAGATASVIALFGIAIRLWVGRRLRQANTLAQIAEGQQRITQDALAAFDRAVNRIRDLERENRLIRQRLDNVRGF